MFNRFPQLSELKGLDIQSYPIHFSLKRLVPGVDNVRCDVNLSREFRKTAGKVVYNLISKHSRARDSVQKREKQSAWKAESNKFKRLCTDVLMSAVNTAKMEREIQILFLAQVTIIKQLLDEIRKQFDALVDRYQEILRKLDISHREYTKELIKLNDEKSHIQKNRKQITCDVAEELFQYIIDILHNKIEDVLISNFGPDSTIPHEIFSNPILHTGSSIDDVFMLERYILLGHRGEDTVTHSAIIAQLKKFFMKLGLHENRDTGKEAPSEKNIKEEVEKKIEGWLNHVDNVNIIFNSALTQNKLNTLKKDKGENGDANRLAMLAKTQDKILNILYKDFSKKGIMSWISSSFEIQPIYRTYCPPLLPLDLLQFLIAPRERNRIEKKLKRLKGVSSAPLSIKPLRQKVSALKKIKPDKHKKYLLKFLEKFIAYNRDRNNYLMLKEAMNWVNLTDTEKTINLSKANHTLYEFLLPHEQEVGEKPIINHVIIKTDVRGSTDITHQIKERGLNPAYYFSRNFFDPITEILSEYGATKVFIEGDAIILTISEKEETPIGWYSVARACGLAINMLKITKKYNVKNKKAKFPRLEQGIGICYHDAPPTFLFDGDNQIMISPAINLADRLSSCAKPLRKLLVKQKRPFNLYVFQKETDNNKDNTVDDSYYRYNVNGIELSPSGFEKLAEEIDLKIIECSIPELQEEKIKIHIGTFPTITGKYQRLIIREDQIRKISDDLKVTGLTENKYYEVCTSSKLYEYVKNMD